MDNSIGDTIYNGIAIANELLYNMQLVANDVQQVINPGLDGNVPLDPERFPFDFTLYTEATNTNDTFNGIWFWEYAEYDSLFNSGWPGPIGLKNIYGQYGNKVIDIFIAERDTSLFQGTGGTAHDPQANAALYISPMWFLHTELAYPERRAYDFALLTLHEICHIMGIQKHTNQETITTQLCDDYNTITEDTAVNNNNLMKSHTIGQALTPCQVDVIYSTFLNSGYEYYSNDLNECNIPNENIIIETGDTVSWDGLFTTDKNIIIEEDAKLIVNCKLQMGSNATICIEKGGELFVDGGTITNACDNERWYGIIVEGSSGNQFSSPQGLLKIKNNAVISNAKRAVSTQLNTGGIIDIDTATFLNNRISIFMYPYIYQNSNGTILNNRTNFISSKFIVDTNYFESGISTKQVVLIGVNGIGFTNCYFENTKAVIESASEMGEGILSLNAGFTIGFRDPTNGGANQPAKPYFKGFYRGILAFGGAIPVSYSVQRTTFEDNVIGILSEGVNQFKIQNNNFIVGSKNLPHAIDDNNKHEGVSVATGSGFLIQNNDYFGDTMPDLPLQYLNPDKVGVRIFNSGISQNAVNNNTYAYLSVANSAEDLNRDGVNVLNGLKYFCNEIVNSSNLVTKPYDIAVTKKDTCDGCGIASNQGMQGNPSKNEFSQLNVGGYDGGDFFNGAEWHILYYYFNTNPKHEPENVFDENVNFIKLDAVNIGAPCGTIGVVGAGSNLPNISDIEDSFDDAISKIDSLNSLKLDSTDGGNSPAMISIIASSSTSTKANVLGRISLESPYLSYKGLTDLLAFTTVYTKSEISTVISDNRHYMSSHEITNTLKDDWSFTINELDSIFTLDTVPPMIVWDSHLSELDLQKNIASDDAIRLYMLDTAGVNIDSVAYWLRKKNTLEAYYSLIDLFQFDNQKSTADLMLDSVKQLFEFEMPHDSIIEQYKVWVSLMATMDTVTNSLENWAVNNRTALSEISNKLHMFPSANTRGIQYVLDTINNYFWEANLPQDTLVIRSYKNEHSNSAKKVTEIWNVFPNPARNILTISKKVVSQSNGKYTWCV